MIESGDNVSRQLVVVPVYNEVETIAQVLCELRRHYSGDVLVVDDGSTDGSVESVAGCGEIRIEVLTHGENSGYGVSLIDGFKWAIKGGYEHVVTMDCDLQHEPHLVPEFFSRMGEADVLSGSRYLTDDSTNDPAPKDRQKINGILTKEIGEITGYEITDTFCGFKGYRVEGLKRLSLNEAGYGFPIQFWMQAWCAGLTVVEIPVARIYKNLSRTFGGELDDPERRLRYYRAILERELNRCREM